MNIKLAKPSEIPQSWYNEVIGLDIETEGKYIDSRICLVSLYNPKGDLILVIPTHAMYENLTWVDIDPAELEILKEFLKTIRVCGANIQFDLARIMYHWGVECDVYLDTFLIGRLFQLEKQGLKDMAVRCKPELAEYIRHFNELVDVKNITFVYNIADSKVVQYSGLDAYLPFVIIKKMAPQLKKYKDIIQLEMDYLQIAYREQAVGLKIDMDLYRSKEDQFKDELEVKEQELNDILGYSFKANSTGQKADLILGQWGLWSPFKTDKGAVSMGKDSLNYMIEELERTL